ncbi:MAG TPA: hypothetical protein DCS93_35255 [Microscillaceae bacterium]|nr:hypothetical protein [Microscillaceae bacterium]
MVHQVEKIKSGIIPAIQADQAGQLALVAVVVMAEVIAIIFKSTPEESLWSMIIKISEVIFI